MILNMIALLLMMWWLQSGRDADISSGELMPAEQNSQGDDRKSLLMGLEENQMQLEEPASELTAYEDSYLDILRSEIIQYLGQYVQVHVKGAVMGRGWFTGFLLRVGDDYIELLCFTYNYACNDRFLVPYIVDIPIDKLAAVTHRPRGNRYAKVK